MARLGWIVALALGSGLPGQTVNAMLPRGGQRGTEVELRFQGNGLADANALLVEGRGIDVVEVAADKDTEARAKVRIAADAELGEHRLVLCTARGVARMRTFQVGTLPESNEREPNDSLAEAEPIELGTTRNGRITAEDTDWFALPVVAGQRVAIEVVGARLGDADWDPQLELFDPSGSRHARMDDSRLGRSDPIATFTPDADGTWLVALRDQTLGGAQNAFYRLHVGTFPRPLGAVPAGGRPGEQIEVELIGDGPKRRETVRLRQEDGLHSHFPQDGDAVAPTPVLFVVRDLAGVVEGAAEPLAAPVAVHGVLAKPGEVDRFEVTMAKGADLELFVIARRLRSPLDAVVQVRDPKGAVLGSNDDQGQLDSRLAFRPPADGEYTVVLFDQLRRGGDEFFYRLEIAPPRRGAVFTEAVPGRRAEDIGVSVPQGGRAAIVIAATRLERGPGTRLTLDGLPAGVRIDAPPLPAGTDLVPIVLHAASDAALGAALVSVSGQDDQGRSLDGAIYAHEVPLVRVFNERVFLSTHMRSVPVAVAKPAPFRLEVTAPRVPIVRGSPLGLAAKVVRDDGYTGDVRVRMLWNPPGIGSGQVGVDAKTTDVVLPLSANDNAPVGRYGIVLCAIGNDGGVAREVCSELVELEVAEPWIDVKVPDVRAELGATVELAIELKPRRELPAPPRFDLRGLPRGVVAGEAVLDLANGKARLPLVIDAKAPVGRHRSQVLRVLVASDGDDVVQDVRTGELRIDRPIEPNGDGP
jgi:hypothetical protein